MTCQLWPQWTVTASQGATRFVRVCRTEDGSRFFVRGITNRSLCPDRLAPDNESLFRTPEFAAHAPLERAIDMKWALPAVPGTDMTWGRAELPESGRSA